MLEHNTEDFIGIRNLVNKIIGVLENLSKNRENCCFSIDGRWGSGKSFLLSTLENNIVTYDMDSDNGYIIFEYNCWYYDFYDEPLEAIIQIIAEQIEQLCNVDGCKDIKKLKDIRAVIIKMGSQLIASKTGIDIFEAISGEKKEADHLISLKQSIDEIRIQLEKISKNNTIVILVDEIDRCLPKYAIKVLERLHHLFSGIENTVTIVAVDRKQLKKTIEQEFGNDISTYEYLKKFFDFSLVHSYEIGEKTVFTDRYKWMSENYNLSNNEIEINKFLRLIFNKKDIRSINRVFDNVELIHNLLNETERSDGSILIFEIISIFDKEFNVLLDRHDFSGGSLIRPITDLVDYCIDVWGKDYEYWVKKNRTDIRVSFSDPIKNGLYLYLMAKAHAYEVKSYDHKLICSFRTSTNDITVFLENFNGETLNYARYYTEFLSGLGFEYTEN